MQAESGIAGMHQRRLFVQTQGFCAGIIFVQLSRKAMNMAIGSSMDFYRPDTPAGLSRLIQMYAVIVSALNRVRFYNPLKKRFDVANNIVFDALNVYGRLFAPGPARGRR